MNKIILKRKSNKDRAHPKGARCQVVDFPFKRRFTHGQWRPTCAHGKTQWPRQRHGHRPPALPATKKGKKPKKYTAAGHLIGWIALLTFRAD